MIELTIFHWVLIILAGYNFIVFLTYGWDKLLAGGSARRVSEKVLLLLALFGGSAGALLGMNFFRHKTKKISFQFKLIIILLLQAGIVYGVYYLYINYL